MEDSTNLHEEQAQTATPDEKSDRDELKEASQEFFRTLFRSGIQLAKTPVNMLPEEPREHFMSAGREFTRGLALFAHEMADNFDKIVDELKEDVRKKE